ncbi:MAG: hypothetical protein ACK4QL_01085 [Pseudanabaenaceae cyanobacterium]
MTTRIHESTLVLMRQFNLSFPKFYEQFVSSEVQLQNLKLAYQLYRTHSAVIELRTEGDKTAFYFAFRNQSYLLNDIFGVFAAYGLSIHSLNVYGQVKPPMLIFLKVMLSRGNAPLSEKLIENVQKAIKETLLGRLDVEEMLASEFNLNAPLKKVECSFYVDRAIQLPTFLIEANSEPALLYKVMNAVWQEDLLVVSANLLIWRGRTKLILYSLGPHENIIPEYLGRKIAESLRHRLGGE